MTLGQTIYELRKQKNLSQGDLADLLEVSRQSISKWETDASVPDLDKLIKLSEIFGVSLNRLVKGEPAPSPEPSVPTQTVIRRSALSGREIAMIILFCTGALAFILVTVLGDILAGLLLASPFILCGTICALCRKRPLLFCCWAIYLFLSLYLISATGTSPNTLTAMLFAGNLNFNIHFILATIEVAVYIGLIIWTLFSYKEYTQHLKGKTLVVVIISAVLIILSYVTADLMARELMQHLGTHVNYAEVKPWIAASMTVNTVISIIRTLSVPILLVNAAAIRHAKSNKK